MPGAIHRYARPPIPMDAAPAPGAVRSAVRPTATPRPWIRPRLRAGDGAGFSPDDPAVRRYWTALVGPGAVADLLRLTAAARTGRSVRTPVHLGLLITEGLVERAGSMIVVGPTVPLLSPGQVRRLRPALRAEYRRGAARAG